MIINRDILCKRLEDALDGYRIVKVDGPVYLDGDVVVAMNSNRMMYDTECMGLRLVRENGLDIEAEIYNGIVSEIVHYVLGHVCKTVFVYEVNSYLKEGGERVGFVYRGALL